MALLEPMLTSIIALANSSYTVDFSLCTVFPFVHLLCRYPFILPIKNNHADIGVNVVFNFLGVT